MITPYSALLFLSLFLRGLQHEVKDKKFGIAFVILSQHNAYHKSLSELLKTNIVHQTANLNSNVEVNVYKSNEDFGYILGHWTIYPLFPKLSRLHNVDWVFFLEDHTNVNIEKVFKLVSTFNASQDIFSGYALHDSDPTIIHHFASADDKSMLLLYPHFSAGFFISFTLIQKLTEECEDCQFSIDPKYELAKFVWSTAVVKLTHEPHLCLNKDNDDCASWIRRRISDCGPSVSSKKVYVAVKTCEKYHKDRVKVLKSTWASYVENLHIFSNLEDVSIPTVQLNVRNVESGHCEKTLSIMNFYITHEIALDWLAIVDDDTLLSFPRLKKFLSCYNSKEDVVLGERYGYSVSSNFGYDYPTGGSGMIFSFPTLKKLVASCKCPSIDSPDDMIIGVCLKNLHIPVTHSLLFHQARPIDYSADFLEPFKHISFHKHWMIDPYAVYNEWLKEDTHNSSQHSEL